MFQTNFESNWSFKYAKLLILRIKAQGWPKIYIKKLHKNLNLDAVHFIENIKNSFNYQYSSFLMLLVQHLNAKMLLKVQNYFLLHCCDEI